MKKLKAFYLFLLLYSISYSQNSAIGLNFMLGFPQGEFKQNVDRTGFGLALDYAYTPNNAFPISIGANIGILNYGSESRRERFSLTIPDVMVNVNRSNNLVNFHFLTRFGPVRGLFRPYFEALLGASYIWTQTEIKDDYGYSEKIASSTNFDDFAWSYGGGGGFLIYLTRFEDKDNQNSSIVDLFLDLKVRYLYGSKARYLKEGSVKIINGYAYYDVYESKTDILSFHLGVTVCF